MRREIMQYLIIPAILLPALFGGLLPVFKFKSRTSKQVYIAAALVIEVLLVCVIAMSKIEGFTLLSMTSQLTVAFWTDSVSRLFSVIAAFGWLAAGIFAFVYTKHMEKEDVFYAFYLISLGAVIGMDYSANLITMYLFFELITLTSMPLVLQDRTKESIRAALKYLFYSIGGAFLALCGIFFLYAYCGVGGFVPGGSIDAAMAAEHKNVLLTVIFIAVVGFGAKAGLYPLHGWLPTAHPVAPAPASAVLSGVIAKAGVLAILRMIFFCTGTELVAGTWVQYAWIGLALFTVFMGSMMAYREKVLKKRLAYSTVSQVSYVLTGLFFMTKASVTGGLLHVLFHACIKICLFLTAGSVIYNTGKTRVDELDGIGRQMPITIWSFTLASLALIGIPPACGFVSKWYLASGALESGLSVVYWLAPVVLLISAILTAGYLLPITIHGFFPGEGVVCGERLDEGGVKMYLPIAILAALTLLLGIFSGGITEWLSHAAEAML